MNREDIIRMAQERGVTAERVRDLVNFAALVASAEREACAKVCDGLADIHAKMNQWDSHKTAETLAQAIRAGAIHD